jgi:hypothetical protein
MGHLEIVNADAGAVGGNLPARLAFRVTEPAFAKATFQLMGQRVAAGTGSLPVRVS